MVAKGIINRLDSVSNLLERKGLVKEAVELDIIANTLEKFSSTLDITYSILKEIINDGELVEHVKEDPGYLKDTGVLVKLIDDGTLFSEELYSAAAAADRSSSKDFYRQPLINAFIKNGRIEDISFLLALGDITDFSGLPKDKIISKAKDLIKTKYKDIGTFLKEVNKMNSDSIDKRLVENIPVGSKLAILIES